MHEKWTKDEVEQALIDVANGEEYKIADALFDIIVVDAYEDIIDALVDQWDFDRPHPNGYEAGDYDSDDVLDYYHDIFSWSHPEALTRVLTYMEHYDLLKEEEEPQSDAVAAYDRAMGVIC